MTTEKMMDRTKIIAPEPPPVTGIERAVAAVRTQTNLAQALGIHQSRVSDWVAKGYVPKKRAARVAYATGIPVEDLLRKRKAKG
jgi:DNA-binding transcriptional regulator YdaS (Cro superfamily)